ncbi:hypothetical protein SPHINGOR109_50692 [Sphingorhabdus sp. 109]|nr:hypothetical protein SPHINGOR109_50692 [Sphingorhabdus sp. 109]
MDEVPPIVGSVPNRHPAHIVAPPATNARNISRGPYVSHTLNGATVGHIAIAVTGATPPQIRLIERVPTQRNSLNLPGIIRCQRVDM